MIGRFNDQIAAWLQKLLNGVSPILVVLNQQYSRSHNSSATMFEMIETSFILSLLSFCMFSTCHVSLRKQSPGTYRFSLCRLLSATIEPGDEYTAFRFPCAGYFSTKNSMRRFSARPASVSFEATVSFSPRPTVLMRFEVMPFAASQFLTVCARSSEST